VLFSDCIEDAFDWGDFDPGDSDSCDEGWSEGVDDGGGGVSDGSLLGTDDG
jgi:hypothetical protein